MNEWIAFLTSRNGRILLSVLLLFVLFAFLFFLCRVIFVSILENIKKQKEERFALLIPDTEKKSDADRGKIIRQMIAPDGIDPAPNSYLVISDAGRDIYVRSFTISSLPKNTSFAETFAELMNFTGCTSSVYVNPVPEGEMSRKLNKHITVLDSEMAAAYGNSNRIRKLQAQYVEAMQWARELECGDNKFFNVGFLFSIQALSLTELNRLSDTFHHMAKKRSIGISACFACQPEAYQANAPLNRPYLTSRLVSGNAIHYFLMDKKSLATVYNYTHSTYTHRTGAVLGTDIFTKKPVIFDIYNHKSFIGIIYGPMGYGKSASIKMLSARNAALGYRFAAVDSQPLKGTGGGEYNPLCRAIGGTVFTLSPESKNVLNLFDVFISKTFEGNEKTLLGTERETIFLERKIDLIVDNLLTMIQATKEISSPEVFVRMDRILRESCAEIYKDRKIFDGDPDSLYEEGIGVTSGRVLKELPTMTDFYKKIVRRFSQNTDESVNSIYRFIIDALADYVRELYYTEKTAVFLSAEEYQQIKETKDGMKFYEKEDGKKERIIALHGGNVYFDGQSTISRDLKSPFINIDISQLPSGTKKDIARQVVLSWLNESVINKNSEDLSSADRIMIIFDEAHENFKFSYGRKLIEEICRTCRKRHCSLILSTQTISEFEDYEETRKIRDLASFHFIFAQPVSEEETLKSRFGLSDSQADFIVSEMGSGGINASLEEIRRHQGEFCLYDREARKVAFIRFSYFAGTEEAMIAETNAEKIEQYYKERAGEAG